MKQRLKPNARFRAALGGAALVLLPAALCAQQVPQPDPIGSQPALADTTQVQLLLAADSLAAEPTPVAAVDSARLEWLRTPPTVRDLVCDRVGCIETDVPHQFNNAVMSYVTLFTARNRGYMQRVLERENFYFPIFEKYLAQYNLPTDLKYLAVVESSLIPTAKSRVGATGLWQFMGPTAGDLRLRRDEWVDERMAPEKATEGACKHLRYLYGVFHDWELVLAAYNWGAGNMQRVMRRTGKKNFWDLYPHLPVETRNYVPTFTAVMYSMKYAHAHGLHSDKLAYQRAEVLDTLNLKGQAFDLRRLSRACGYADSLYLTRYNPELRRAGLPAGYRPYVVHYPAAARPELGGADYATLVAYCQPTGALPAPLAPRPVRLEGAEPWASNPLLAATAGPRAPQEAAAPRFRKLTHTLRRGETLASLAERFEVSAAQLRRWNDLSKKAVPKPGRKLLVFVPLPAAAPRPVAEAVAAAPAALPTTEVPTVLRPALTPEEAAARRELAAANTREVARLAALAEQERRQEIRLAELRRRQQAIDRAAARIAAVQAAAQARAARTLAAAAPASGVPVEEAGAEPGTAAATNGSSPAASAAVADATNGSEAGPATAATSAAAANAAAGEPQPTASITEDKPEYSEATDEGPTSARPGRNLNRHSGLAAEHPVAGRGGRSPRAAEQEARAAQLGKARQARQQAEREQLEKIRTERIEAEQARAETARAAEQAAVAARRATRVAEEQAAQERIGQEQAEEKGPVRAAFYTVRPGDYLTKLAREHGLSVAQLREWNQLREETVVPGQRLRLTAPAGGAAARSASAHRAAEGVGSKAKTHQVQPGDTLYNISRRFGVSVQQLRELNHLTTDEVKLGQKLLVPQG